MVQTGQTLSRLCHPSPVPNQYGVYSDSEWFIVRFDSLTTRSNQLLWFWFNDIRLKTSFSDWTTLNMHLRYLQEIFKTGSCKFIYQHYISLSWRFSVPVATNYTFALANTNFKPAASSQ